MASPAADIGQCHQQHHPETDSAVQEAQTWIEAVTGRCFGDRDFRAGLENGILLCELLSSIRPGLVKKINRLPTPVAAVDNLAVFLRGCEDLGLKGSQLFDPGDLQDSSSRPASRGSDCSRKLRNVLITIYWLGRATNSCTAYSGPTLDLKEFDGLLSQMRKEAEEAESPQRSIRDSGYIDCWDSERSDSLSPPRHGREDSFDSLDSFGSRSRQTPSPDVLVARGSSDGRGSDSESDGPPHRKMPDIRKDDMLARRTSVTELRTAMPFNQYLPNKSNQSGYVPTPLRKKRADKEDGGRKSWSTATSPVGGDRPFSPNQVCSLDVTPAESPSPSPTPPCPPHMQIQKEDEAAGQRPSSTPSTELHVGVRRSSEPPPFNPPQPHAEPPRETVAPLTAASEHSTPSRSCSEELFHHSLKVAAASAHAAAEDAALRKDSTDAAEGDDKRPQHATSPSPSDFLPLPAAVETSDSGRRKERALSERDERRDGTAWADCSLPAKSVSMIDMRGEEEGVLQPHSQVRHELMHNQYNRLKEEEDHWQDDLARWKNRRRSISQDLIKKEEERKMMEQLMSGGSCVSQRRRSIKTYREIVEDKERREEELRLAYRRARTPEEASAILQRYAQRFSISEAVLERLQLPKLLDRSVSADPAFPCALPLSVSLSASPTTPDPFDCDPDGPLRYLRQQSAPAPKFTSTLEARVEEFPKDSAPHHRPQIRSRSSEPPATRALSPKAVPLLTPKPYLSRPSAAETWSSKADGLLRVNGDAGGDDLPASPESRETESAPRFQASPSPSTGGSAEASVPVPAPSPSPSPAGRESPVSTTAEENQRGTSAAPEDSAAPARPTSLPAELQTPEQSFGQAGGRSSEEGKPNAEASAEARPGETRSDAPRENVQAGVEAQQLQERASRPEDSSHTAAMPPLSSLGLHPNTELEQSGRSPLAASSPQLRLEFFAPSENPDKDRRGNEKYEREQEKLREEWEKAQREVAEEERKYHEEERRILEATVTPLTPRSSALPSPSRTQLSSASEPRDAIVRSLADWERKQELLERQTKESGENVECRRRENDRTSDISTADDSMKTGRSLMSMSSSQAETAAHSLQNGQKPPPASGKASTPVKKPQEASDSGRSGRPAGERRSGSSDSKGRGPCRPPAAASEPPAPNRSVSGKKLCSSCGQPLGKGAAMIIETLSLYFHIHCFKCGVCKGQLGDTTTGTDVRIRNGLLNCHQCYIRSRSAGQPTTL
ncbi:LIM and calponin homology domains-containing protein 1 isoform X2 [Salarias fasciatus]|uniref:LIM and calponin homology domains-containing protein 1 isoform X2 n=1 Tax=Salarias fasciatus TaxID=181472 RepID=UPI0011768DA4|nr:LIM and calponin homology domains-containing protein 1 isoform X2 [Salarias fasciatus]